MFGRHIVIFKLNFVKISMSSVFTNKRFHSEISNTLKLFRIAIHKSNKNQIYTFPFLYVCLKICVLWKPKKYNRIQTKYKNTMIMIIPVKNKKKKTRSSFIPPKRLVTILSSSISKKQKYLHHSKTSSFFSCSFTASTSVPC